MAPSGAAGDGGWAQGGCADAPGSPPSLRPKQRDSPAPWRLWNGTQLGPGGLSGGSSGWTMGPGISCQLGSREQRWVLSPLSPSLPGSSWYVLCSDTRASACKPGFLGQRSPPPGMENPHLDIMTPPSLRLSLGTATKPFPRNETRFWSPGLSFDPGLAVSFQTYSGAPAWSPSPPSPALPDAPRKPLASREAAHPCGGADGG